MGKQLKFGKAERWLAAVGIGALMLHFWPMAYWSSETLVVLRITAAFCAQLFLCRTVRHGMIRLLPLLLCAGLALWGGWLFFTSPVWASSNVSLLWYGLDSCSPVIACAAACLLIKWRQNMKRKEDTP